MIIYDQMIVYRIIQVSRVPGRRGASEASRGSRSEPRGRAAPASYAWARSARSGREAPAARVKQNTNRKLYITQANKNT